LFCYGKIPVDQSIIGWDFFRKLPENLGNFFNYQEFFGKQTKIPGVGIFSLSGLFGHTVYKGMG
jgi:hypothetical protein